MSEWRQKGFVQDSDEEEEESQLESQKSKQHALLQGRVERVDDVTKIQDEEIEEGNVLESKEEGGNDHNSTDISRTLGRTWTVETPRRPGYPKRPTVSPLTPVATYDARREPTESPDPLQSSPTPKSRRTRRQISSQLLGAPAFLPSVAPPESPQHGDALPQLLESPPIEREPTSISANVVRPQGASNILGAFGVDPLSDLSDDDSLSDPPTDLESPEAAVVNTQPHRKTAVQVVIPSSTALQRHIWEQRSRREFRQRKPIQLHPYALEGELYRREVQSRGLNPVPKPRSPDRRASHNDVETQEEAFDPNASPFSSPPEPEISVSTPARKARREGQHGSSIRRRASDPPRRRLPATQLRVPNTAKRRKLNIPSTQIPAEPRSIFDDEPQRRDIWSIPPNSPPYSSSPGLHAAHARGRLGYSAITTSAPNLPTPSTSSILQEDSLIPLDSDTDLAPRSARPSGELRRPRRVISDEDSSSSSGSASEAEKSETEVQQVRKKIRGVLPASWLRFDRQAQERREALARERQRQESIATQSSEPLEFQRGVAQKVTKRGIRRSKGAASSTKATDVVIISDASDSEPDVPAFDHSRNVQHSVDDAVALATALDSRYADDDSDQMENDPLHLFTLGGSGAKRKTQTKLTDAFAKAKRVKATDGKSRKACHGAMKHPHARRALHTPPPALSVIDLDLSPSKRGEGAPQFMRLAKRQALRRSDLARQSPGTKQIRLHSARDTEDANLALQQWRHGHIKPKANVKSKRPKTARSPLADRIDNQQSSVRHTQAAENKASNSDHVSITTSHASGPRSTLERPAALDLFQRISARNTPSARQPKKPPRFSKVLERSARRPPLPFRTGQLEGDESAYGDGHRKFAFEKGLRGVDKQPLILSSNNHSYMNPQLARFLADDDAALPPLPSARDIGEHMTHEKSRQAPPVRRRLIKKKRQAQRIDVEAREYRQPSEPTVQEMIIENLPDQGVNEVVMPDQLALQGLGPYGTRYPTTFDVSYLQAETYFHESTIVGSGDLQRALSIGRRHGRDLDETAGYCSISDGVISIRCGPWNDETSSTLHQMAHAVAIPLQHGAMAFSSMSDPVTNLVATDQLATFLRALMRYISSQLSFSDPVDRRSFVVKIHQLLFSLFDQVSVVYAAASHTGPFAAKACECIRVMTLLLVVSCQIVGIAAHNAIDPAHRSELLTLTRSIAKTITTHVVQKGLTVLSNFLEQNMRHTNRQNGIQENDVLVQAVVVCMHTLECMPSPGTGFWDLVSQELSPGIARAAQLHDFESTWAILFTLLPFHEMDILGIPSKDRRDAFPDDNWQCISAMLRRLFELYPATYRKHSTSLNEYVRATLMRCHRLIRYWHWQRPEQMLNAVFDFFGKNGLKQLRRETISGSVSFLDTTSTEQTTVVGPNECSFHIALKCLAIGLAGMRKTYTEKKMRSFVFRTIPNHGRTYPKDQPLDEESLAALRNHHDLLCTLYWAAPPACRPKLDLIRGLINHETSHREACRVNVRAWTNLTAFQLSTDEPYTSAKPFASWHKEIMHQSLKQYQLAKTEADDYLKSGVLDGTTDVSAVMVRQTMERNQEQVIATLRDCIAGMRKAFKSAKDSKSIDSFLVDSDIMHLLELPHLDDRRLVNVLRDTLALLREFSKSQKALSGPQISQNASEESQDYGDFPDIDDFDDIGSQPAEDARNQASLDLIQNSLWHLLSNAFGAEVAPDDNLLMECVDTWVLIADATVASGARSWTYFIESFSQVSWHQLRQTEQTRKFGSYFLATLIQCDPTAYEEHRHDFITVLVLSLVDRESLLRFQHRLLHAIAQTDQDHPLMKNLPFFKSLEDGAWDITADSVRSRRLAVISSMLSNMRDDLHHAVRHDTARASEVKRSYAALLKELMMRMKSNYQQLQQGSTVTGAYVEFVQKIVQFLKQYTGDICPVLPFFTDSVAFPLPSTDPTYVVGRLCGYAPKVMEPGTAKQLSVFIQTVAQQAAADNQQLYLVNQLTTALCSEEAPAADRVALRSILLQGIFPAYLEEAFASSATLLIARPVLQSLRPILNTMIFDLHIHQPESVAAIVGTIVSVSHAFIRGSEHLKTTPMLFEEPQTLSALASMLEAMCSVVPVLEYICSRSPPTAQGSKPPLVMYMEQFSIYVAETIHNMVPHTTPYYQGNAHATISDSYTSLLAFCKRGLNDSIKANWSERGGAIWFGQGQAKREVVLDVGSVEEERARLDTAIEAFHGVLRNVYGDGIQGLRGTASEVDVVV
ncbi:Mus7/MMS22 family-domain-containing protein [Paraphoma chrysanthemicola]|uniref:Mus7/MMS22 family-domain-containing protein n=1 Tax=Paraphoma chrysanthemicola TaxID=798071 RepID=A0A8K0W102_9PLEO|nr:Mus7/MMS22 family-domain-containing protein [Paraphoma chrysanthemicola]